MGDCGKPVITIRRGSPNANIYAVIGIAHAAIMAQGFRRLMVCRDYMIDGDLIVANATTIGKLMKEKALAAKSYEDAIKAVEEYVTINWN